MYHYFFYIFSKFRIKNSLFILKPNLSSLPMQLIIKKLLIIIYIHYSFEIGQLKLFASKNILLMILA